MISLIIGEKGSGKTKWLVEEINKTVKNAKGSVVCIEKGDVSTVRVDHRVRLVDTNDYAVSSFSELYGLISGLLAGNYDIETVYVDATLRIGGRDYEALHCFLEKVRDNLSHETDFVFTLSCPEDKIDETRFDGCYLYYAAKSNLTL